MRASQAFSKEINLLGRVTSIIALIAMFSVPLVTAYAFKIELSFSELMAASAGLVAIYLPTAVVENLSFYSVLGAGGMYLSSITGNITNMKLPVTVAGQKIAGAEPGTDEGDVVAILSVGVSSLVTVFILVLGAFLIGSWLVPILNHPLLKVGFDHITPALYGAITVPQILKQPKLAIAPAIFVLALFFILGPAGFAQYQSYILISSLIVSCLAAYVMFRNGWLAK
ncbi:hypothetical protein AWM75_00945 [Aerococcus urinaehominis]|uniref:Uncharacterized protein n=2 Tax=Aerococcus urinaehominis TaxID=128944 RepID=A0A120IB38_9LACT|nr:hypothetical protein AWM75_00945 [Aerococcus urinaehominis]